MFKKLFILLAGFMGCLFFAEIILQWDNPLLPKEIFTPHPLEHYPDYHIVGNKNETERKNICFAGSSFLLSNQVDSGTSFVHLLMNRIDSTKSAAWCSLAKENWNFQDYDKLNRWLKKNRPDALVLFIGSEAYPDFLTVPNCFVNYEEDGLLFTENTRPEIIKTIRYLSLKIEGEKEIPLWKLFPFDKLSLSDSLMKLDRMQRKEMNQSLAVWLKSLQKIYKTSKELKIELTIVSSPSIFSNQNELLTGYPIAFVNLPNQLAGSVYGESHQSAVKTIKEWSRMSKSTVIDISSRFPSDYRFFIDGIHLSETGHTFYADLLYNELLRKPFYRNIF